MLIVLVNFRAITGFRAFPNFFYAYRIFLGVYYFPYKLSCMSFILSNTCKQSVKPLRGCINEGIHQHKQAQMKTLTAKKHRTGANIEQQYLYLIISFKFRAIKGHFVDFPKSTEFLRNSLLQPLSLFMSFISQRHIQPKVLNLQEAKFIEVYININTKIRPQKGKLHTQKGTGKNWSQ